MRRVEEQNFYISALAAVLGGVICKKPAPKTALGAGQKENPVENVTD